MAVAATAQGSSNVLGAAASVVTNLVSNIFGASQAKAELNLKAQEQHFQDSLAGLSNEQSYVLKSQLQAAQSDAQRLQILTAAVTQVKLAQVNNSNSQSNKTMYLVLGILFLAIVALMVIKRN